jgi:hypothetical protein
MWRNKGGSGSLLNDVNNNDYVDNRVQISNTTISSTTSNDTSKDNYKIIQSFLSLLTKYFNSRTLVLFNEGSRTYLRQAYRTLFFIPFYASTTIWEYDLHFFPDCLHPGCYTPFYWISLFDTIFEVFSGVKTENR